MVAGLNIHFRVWRIDYGTDDAVGGAMVTGSISYEHLIGRLQANPPSQLLLQQGLETVRTFNLMVRPGTLDIDERDEVEVVYPTPDDHPYYHKRFRVRGVQDTNFHPRDERGYLLLSLTRSEEAHAQQ